jgi:H/ACA ribonucleoprotein complex subunit 3
MPQRIYVAGKQHRLDPSAVIGQGGEAVVYRYGREKALKVYLPASDPMYAKEPGARDAARRRLDEHQRKLPAFPTNLPDHVVAPELLAYDSERNGRVVGYAMEFMAGLEVLLSYADRDYRQRSGIDANQAIQVFRNLHGLVAGVHAAGVVIGDFNDLNVLVSNQGETYLVDADSMQFDQFLCRTFTMRFMDPLISAKDKLQMAAPHNQSSDWYAYATMLFQTLLFINPYMGVHRPKSGKRLRDAQRILNRITIFSPDVVVPKAAIPHTALPDELMDFFVRLYEQDTRGEFPASLLDNLRWTTCTSCSTMHARQTCPTCATANPAAVRQTVTVRGSVTATRQFQTSGVILYATAQGGVVRYVYHESGVYKREGDITIIPGNLDKELRVRIWGDRTVLAKGTTLVALDPQGSQAKFETQLVGRLPVFAANGSHLYWIDGDHLHHDAPLGTTTIGTILPNRTLVWVGDRFGFGFFRAGSLVRGFIFDASRPGLNDSVPLPPLRGTLIDATCVFSDRTAWFMVTIEQDGTIKNHCYVITNNAELLAHAEATQGDGTWLGESIRGRLARGQQLFAATDTGIVRIGLNDTSLQVEATYPDTEPFVTSQTQLLPSREGIVAVSNKEITLLQIRSSN